MLASINIVLSEIMAFEHHYLVHMYCIGGTQPFTVYACLKHFTKFGYLHLCSHRKRN